MDNQLLHYSRIFPDTVHQQRSGMHRAFSVVAVQFPMAVSFERRSNVLQSPNPPDPSLSHYRRAGPLPAASLPRPNHRLRHCRQQRHRPGHRRHRPRCVRCAGKRHDYRRYHHRRWHLHANSPRRRQLSHPRRQQPRRLLRRPLLRPDFPS